MIDFDFVSPTKIYFGKGKEQKIGEIISSYSFKRVGIVIGQGHVKKSGLLDAVKEKLLENHIEFVVFEGIRPNPTRQECKELIKVIKDFKVDLLLAIGGGSVIDAAKNAACGYYYEGDSFDFNLHKVKPEKALPIGVILTIAAAGSELSQSCVIQDDEKGIKNGFLTDLIRPLFVVENPELTYKLPKKQIAYGIVDIMMHTMERFFSQSSECEPADELAVAVLKSVIKIIEKAYKEESNYEALASLMLMSSISHNGLTGIGKKLMMPVHQLEHALSGKYPEVAHAAGLALIFPNWAKYYLDIDTAKFAQFGRKVFDINEKDDYTCALQGIKEIEKIYDFLNMPKKFSDLGLKNVDTLELAKLCTLDDSRPLPHYIKSLDSNEVKKIYDMCL